MQIAPVSASLLIGSVIPIAIGGIFHALQIATIFHSLSAHRIWFLGRTVLTYGRLTIPYALVGSALFLIGLNFWNKRRVSLSLSVLFGASFLAFIVPAILGLISIGPIVRQHLIDLQIAPLRLLMIHYLISDAFSFGITGLLGGLCGATFLGWNKRYFKLISVGHDQNLLLKSQPDQMLLDQKADESAAQKGD